MWTSVWETHAEEQARCVSTLWDPTDVPADLDISLCQSSEHVSVSQSLNLSSRCESIFISTLLSNLYYHTSNNTPLLYHLLYITSIITYLWSHLYYHTSIIAYLSSLILSYLSYQTTIILPLWSHLYYHTSIISYLSSRILS